MITKGLFPVAGYSARFLHAIIGRYIRPPDIFDLPRSTPPGMNNEVQLTYPLQTQAANGKVIAYRYQGKRFDCGSVEGFFEATNFFSIAARAHNKTRCRPKKSHSWTS